MARDYEPDEIKRLVAVFAPEESEDRNLPDGGMPADGGVPDGADGTDLLRARRRIALKVGSGFAILFLLIAWDCGLFAPIPTNKGWSGISHATGKVIACMCLFFEVVCVAVYKFLGYWLD